MSKQNFKGNNRNKNVPKSGTLPQYGKKGHTPREEYAKKFSNLDKLAWNDITDWNAVAGYDEVTKFNWDLIVGRPRNPLEFSAADERDGVHEFLPTQLMKLNVVTGPGWADNVNDGVNRALAQVMANIRANLSTSNIGFETADLGIFFASTASIAAMIGYAKRILELVNKWDGKNYAYPRLLMSSMTMDFEFIKNNINVYTPRLNAIIDMYNNIEIVDCWRTYDRHYSMFHSIFLDEDSPYGQAYMFCPANYYVYDDTNSKAKSNWINNSTFQHDFEVLLETIESQINAWYTSSDLYQINGVLLRAFKNAPRQHIPHHEITNSPTINVDRSFLMQIMNCTINNNIELSSLDITQDPNTQNFVIWKPKANPASQVPMYNHPYVLLRLFEDHPTNDDNMEMTRLINFVNTTNNYYEGCGSEIVSSIELWKLNAATGASYSTILTSNDLILSSAGTTWYDYLENYLGVCPFRYIPAIHVIYTDGGDRVYYGMFGDVYNYTVYSRVDWLELQSVAMRSLWKPRNLGIDAQ